MPLYPPPPPPPHTHTNPPIPLFHDYCISWVWNLIIKSLVYIEDVLKGPHRRVVLRRPPMQYKAFTGFRGNILRGPLLPPAHFNKLSCCMSIQMNAHITFHLMVFFQHNLTDFELHVQVYFKVITSCWLYFKSFLFPILYSLPFQTSS